MIGGEPASGPCCGLTDGVGPARTVAAGAGTAGPRVRVINPNTDAAMTRSIGRAAAAAAGPGTVVETVCPAMGPASIESHYDEALAVPGLLQEVARGEADGVDAFLVACFGDPGLEAARELATVPVLGLAQAGFHLAALLGRKFAVVTTLERTVGRACDLLGAYGFAERCTGVWACEVPVLDLEDPQGGAYSAVAEAGHRAVAAQRPDAVVLGCAGMAALTPRLRQEWGVPVVDGVAAGVRLAESVAALGLVPSDRGEFARPRPKPYLGLLEPFGLTAPTPPKAAATGQD